MYEMIVIPLFYCYNFLFLFWIFYFFIFIALQCKPLKDEKIFIFHIEKKEKYCPITQILENILIFFIN